MTKFREIKIDLDVWKEIVARSTVFDEEPNNVLRRMLKLDTPTIRFDGNFGFELKGNEHPAGSARGVLVGVLEALNTLDENIIARFADLPKHGRSRRFVALNKENLYHERPDLCEQHSHQLHNGYWVGTNYGRVQIRKILQMVCETAHLEWNKDLKVYLKE